MEKFEYDMEAKTPAKILKTDDKEMEDVNNFFNTHVLPAKSWAVRIKNVCESHVMSEKGKVLSLLVIGGMIQEARTLEVFKRVKAKAEAKK